MEERSGGEGDAGGAQGLRLIIQACHRLYPEQKNPLQVGKAPAF